jgi:hypothetical protein
MEHEEAVRLDAAELYVAGQLSEEQRDAFEEHYFDCPICAEEVRMEQVFAANLQAVLREPDPPAVPQSWWSRLAMHPGLTFSSLAANAALAVVVGLIFLNGFPRGDVARFLPSYYAPGTSHGTEEIHPVPAGSASMVVRVPVPTEQYTSYSYEILDAGGKTESRGSATPPEGEAVDLYLEVPVRSLTGGDHTLVVRGNPGQVVSQSKFHISHLKKGERSRWR